MSDLISSTCRYCDTKDTEPDFIELHGDKRPLLRVKNRKSQIWVKPTSSHHQCAVKFGHNQKAAVIVSATKGATGANLRAQLTDPSHLVHQAVVEHTNRHAAIVAVETYRVLAAEAMARGEQLPPLSVNDLLGYFEATNPNPTGHFVDHVANLVGLSMVTALTQTQANNFLNALLGAGSFTARTGAVTLALDSVTSSQSSAGTEVTGGSYARQTCAFGSSSSQTGTYAGQIANSGTPTYTNMPAITVTGIDNWDSAGTPVRLVWGALTASKTTNSGDTVSVAVGAVTVSV